MSGKNKKTKYTNAQVQELIKILEPVMPTLIVTDNGIDNYNGGNVDDGKILYKLPNDFFGNLQKYVGRVLPPHVAAEWKVAAFQELGYPYPEALAEVKKKYKL